MLGPVRSVAMRAAVIALAANAGLLALKAVATGLSDSLTVFSETMNSLADLIASVVVVVCVRWAHRTSDEDHPFGHGRAEPIAGLLVAIFTCILGFEVCRAAAIDLYAGKTPRMIGGFAFAALAIAGVLKAALAVGFFRLGRKVHSPALRAVAIDCRNDVLVVGQGLLGVGLAAAGLGVFDRVSATLVGLYILYSGYQLLVENVDYLMGKAPSQDLLDDIEAAAGRTDGVRETDDVKAHYVGAFVHVELTVRVDGSLSTDESHAIAEASRGAVERLPAVDRAFIHIEPTR